MKLFFKTEKTRVVIVFNTRKQSNEKTKESAGQSSERQCWCQSGESGGAWDTQNPELKATRKTWATELSLRGLMWLPGPPAAGQDLVQCFRPMAGPGIFCLLRELSQPPPRPTEQSTCLRSSQVSSCPLPPKSHTCARPPPGTHTVFVPAITLSPLPWHPLRQAPSNPLGFSSCPTASSHQIPSSDFGG